MIKQYKGNSQILLLLVVVVASTSLYVVFNNIPTGIGSFRWFWGPISVGIVLLMKPKVLFSKPMKYVVIYGVLFLVILQYLLWTEMSDWNIRMLLNKFYGWFVISAIFSYFISRKDFYGLAVVGKWAFIFFLVTLIMTFVALQFDSMVVRQSANPDGFSTFQNRLFAVTGCGGYGFVQSVALFFPVIIGQIKSGRKLYFLNKSGMIGLLIFMWIVLLQAQVFANIIMAVTISILALLGAQRFKRAIIIFTVFFIGLSLIPSKNYSQTFRGIAIKFDNSSTIYAKFMDFSYFIEAPELNDETGTAYRTARYPLLFEGLSESPLLGYASNDFSLDIDEGGHLEWMNKLTIWGIPMFLLFVLLMFRYFKTVLRLFKNPFSLYYLFTLLAYFLIGLMKVTESRATWVMLLIIIPGVYFAPLLQNNKTVN